MTIETRQTEQPIELSAERASFIEKQNPQFKERHVDSGKPGEGLNQDTFFVGALKGVGRVYMHVVVDTWCSYAFAVSHNDVLPFHQKHRMKVMLIPTRNGREFCDTENHPYELYLELNHIKASPNESPSSTNQRIR